MRFLKPFFLGSIISFAGVLSPLFAEVITEARGQLAITYTELSTQNEPFEVLLSEKLRQADKAFSETDYALAETLYQKLSQMPLVPEGRAWVTFRLADSYWRARLKQGEVHPSVLRRARQDFASLLEGIEADDPANNDLIAEIEASIADTFWLPSVGRDREKASVHYVQALERYARSTNREKALKAYFKVLYNISVPLGMTKDGAIFVPSIYWENALKIANNNADLAFAYYGLARAYAQEGAAAEVHAMAGVNFEKAVMLGLGEPWLGEALFEYAQWAEKGGGLFLDGRVRAPIEPSPALALELYERYLLLPGAITHINYKDVVAAIASLKEPGLKLNVPMAFLSGVDVSFYLEGAHVDTVDLYLYPVDLTEVFDFESNLIIGGALLDDWVSAINVSERTPAMAFTSDIPVATVLSDEPLQLTLPQSLDKGTYLIEARSGNCVARGLVVVGELALIVQSTKDTAWVYACRGDNGLPASEINIAFFAYASGSEDDPGIWIKRMAKTNAEGLATFRLPSDMHIQGYFIGAMASSGEGAYAVASHLPRESWGDVLDLCVLSDRAAYQIGDVVNWKLAIPKMSASGPSMPRLFYEIEDAMGNVIADGPLIFSDMGTASGSLILKSFLPLGSYFLVVKNDSGKALTPRRSLFTLEKFRLPELVIELKTQDAQGLSQKSFLRGESILIKAEARSRAGAALAGSLVELKIYRTAYAMPKGFDLGPLLETRVLQTNEHGVLSTTFLPPFSEEDYYYTFLLRFPGLSEEEPPVYETVAATEERYIVHLTAKELVVAPGKSIDLALRTTDVWGNPVARLGHLCLLREGVLEEDVLTQVLSTDEEGTGILSLTLPSEGRYTALWVDKGQDQDTRPVQASLSFWAAPMGAVNNIVSHGFSVTARKAPYKVGEAIPVLISLPSAEGTVLVSIVSDQLLLWKCFQPSARVHRLDLVAQANWGPNVDVHVTWVADFEVVEGVVPLKIEKIEEGLVIETAWDKPRYRPGEKGQLTVRVMDQAGCPIPAEVALTITDLMAATLVDPFSRPLLPVLAPEVSVFKTRTHSSFESLSYGGRLFDQIIQAEDKENVAFGYTFLSDQVPQVVPPAPHLVGEAKWTRAITRIPKTLLWEPFHKTNRVGERVFTVTFPEYLSPWDFKVWAIAPGGRFGNSQGTVTVEAPFDLSLPLPAFFVAGDTALITANLESLSQESSLVDFQWEVEGAFCLRGANKPFVPDILTPRQKTIFPQWVAFTNTGKANFELSAQGVDFTEALSTNVPILHAWPKRFLNKSIGSSNSHVELAFELPRLTDFSATRVCVSVATNLPSVLLDALSYLKMSDVTSIEGLASRLAAFQITHQFASTARIKLEGLSDGPALSRGYLKKLLRFQNKDGGWPWVVGGVSDPWTTAYTLWALTISESFSGFEVPAKCLKQARLYLEHCISDPDLSVELEAIIFHALASRNMGRLDTHPGRKEVDLFSKLWKQRDKLGASALARLAIGAYFTGLEEEAVLLAHRLLHLAVVPDNSGGIPMLLWPADNNFSSAEVTAFSVFALAAVMPADPALEKGIQALLLQRQGAAWRTGRETALCILALNRYLMVSPFIPEEASYKLYLGDQLIEDVKIDPLSRTIPSSSVMINGDQLSNGLNTLRLERVSGHFPSIVSVLATYRTPPLPEGLSAEAFRIERYYDHIWTEPTLLSGYVELRERLKKTDSIRCGEVIETVLLIEVKEPVKYIKIQDPLPSGFERVYSPSFVPLEVRSVLPSQVDHIRAGNRTGLGCVYGPKRRVLFQSQLEDVVITAIDELLPGFWEIRYRLRADSPGLFQARVAQMKKEYDPFVQSFTKPATLRVVDDTLKSKDLPAKQVDE